LAYADRREVTLSARRHLSDEALQILRFLVVGAVGFLVDAAALLLLVHGVRVSPIWARIPSLLIAITTTWWLHRHFTFAWARLNAASSREWLRFVFANAVGNGINLCIYWTLIASFGWSILAALTLASVVAAGINYGVSARWVFKRT
jgi:putative flippase GtrA